MRFISRIDADIGFVAIDKVQFQQVISNLLDNAVKFAREDDPTVFLSAEVQLEIDRRSANGELDIPSY